MSKISPFCPIAQFLLDRDCQPLDVIKTGQLQYLPTKHNPGVNLLTKLCSFFFPFTLPLFCVLQQQLRQLSVGHIFSFYCLCLLYVSFHLSHVTFVVFHFNSMTILSKLLVQSSLLTSQLLADFSYQSCSFLFSFTVTPYIHCCLVQKEGDKELLSLEFTCVKTTSSFQAG